MPTEIWLQILTLIGGSVAFIIGLTQYRVAQNWKKAEFVASEIKEAFAEPSFVTATILLDWNQTLVDLGKVDHLKNVDVNDAMLQAAWRPHIERPGGFSDLEVRLRDILDVFLTRIQRFEHFIEIGLVKSKDFYPFLRYWIKIVGDPKAGRKSTELQATIWRYIAFYELDDVQRFFKRYGYDITPKDL